MNIKSAVSDPKRPGDGRPTNEEEREEATRAIEVRFSSVDIAYALCKRKYKWEEMITFYFISFILAIIT